MNVKKLTISSAVAGAILFAPAVSFAAGNGYGTSNCQVIYGGGEVCPKSLQFTVDKKVQSPNKGGSYIDNLGFNDAKFVPGSEIAFKITVRNTGEANIDEMVITDTLPEYLTFTAGVGNYDKNNRTVTYSVKNLPKGQQNEQTIVAKINDASSLPNEAVKCLTNKVRATDNNGSTAEDSSAFCVQKQVVNGTPKGGPQVEKALPPKTIPNTGPELLPLLGLIPAGISGYFLRKKSRLS